MPMKELIGGASQRMMVLWGGRLRTQGVLCYSVSVGAHVVDEGAGALLVLLTQAHSLKLVVNLP